MKDTTFTLISNRPVAKNTYEWVLSGDTKGIREGQFVNIKLDGFYLRRPISVCDCEGDKLTLIFKVVGDGTKVMSEAKEGEKFLILTGLGNGYNLAKSGHAPLLIGGGAGVPPMYLAAKKLVAKGITPTVILGFNTADEVFYKDEFETLGCKVLITTADGSVGIKGFVTNAMADLEYVMRTPWQAPRRREEHGAPARWSRNTRCARSRGRRSRRRAPREARISWLARRRRKRPPRRLS